MSAAAALKSSKLRHARVLTIPISDIEPSPENLQLYRPVDPNDPDIIALAESIRIYGVKEPLVVTLDYRILSGHRRHVAAALAGLEQVPCVVEQIYTFEDKFLPLLREYNRQRVKGFDEILREEIVSAADPEEAYQSLIEERKAKSAIKVKTIEIVGTKTRCEISEAKNPFVEAIKKVMNKLREIWPLSDRTIHYGLLNHRVLKHVGKPDSIYCNDKASYNSLTELLTRMRLSGVIPFESISDDTRPIQTWNVYANTAPFIRSEMDEFLRGYWRDLLQSQPRHIEIVGEKNTIAGIIKPVAARYCIPMTLGRGYCSLRPRYDMQQRFLRSGKGKLIVLILSDFDPDGIEISHSFTRSQTHFHFAAEFDKGINQNWLAWTQRLNGDTAGAKITAAQARNTLQPLCNDQPDNAFFVAELSWPNAVLGEKEAALREAERAAMLWIKDRLWGPASEELLAVIQMMVGENSSRAISTLTRLLQTPGGSWIYGYGGTPVTPALLRLDPHWDPLRADPAFQKLCEEKQP